MGGKEKDYSLVEFTMGVVYEDPAEPTMMSADYEINCHYKIFRPIRTNIFWRDNGFTQEEDQRFRPVVAGTPLAEMIPIVCKWGPKKPSARRKEMVAAFSNAYLPISDVWDKLLSGAKRPLPTTSKSERQIEAEKAHNVRQQKIAQELEIMRQKQAEREAEEREFRDRLLEWKHSVGDQGNPTMHSWIGAKIGELTSSWGYPTSSRYSGNGKQLIYSSYKSFPIFNGGVQIGLQEYYCHKSFFTERDYVVTWREEGNNC
ncbi:MAG: hypothetical protein HC843_00865 [Sphingomonadales bacterium]|nr:hypothetical protein [Sphingomonadales bacterium]